MKIKLFPNTLLCIGSLLMSLCAGVASADSAQEQKLKQIQKEIGALQQTLKTDKSQHSQLIAELRRAEKHIAQISSSLRDTRKRLNKQSKTYQQVRDRVRELSHNLNELRDQLAKHMRAGYSAGHQPALKLLLNEEDPAKAGRTLTYYRYVTQAQLRVMDDTKKTIAELRQTELQLQEETRKLEELKVEQEQQHRALVGGKAKREDLLAQLGKQIQTKEQKLQQLTADAKRLANLVQTLQSEADINIFVGKDLGQLKTKLKWPVKSKVRHRFGSKRGQTSLKWQGVYLDARENQDIHAIAPGRVVFADWLRGYGLTLIVDHGHSYMSIYSHNQTLYKKRGDAVLAREVVAGAGSTGGHKDYGLYFEIRYKGKPVNPSKWCR